MKSQMTNSSDQRSPNPRTPPDAAAGSLSIFSTDAVPLAQRADYWHGDVLRRLDTSGAQERAPFRAQLMRLSGDGMQMLQHSGDALVAQRSASRCRRDECDDISIDYVARSNNATLIHNGTHRVNTGDMIVMDLARPAEIHRAQHRVISLFIPRARLRTAFSDPSALAGRLLQPHGLPAILRSQMKMTMDQAKNLRPEQLLLALKAVAELALAVLRTEMGQPVDVEQSATGIYQAAKTLIGCECADPALTPSRIARALGCSRAGLYRAFAAHGDSVAAMIWSARIERARLMLISVDCQLRVGEIAFRSGFSEHSSFDRMFRRRYGMTPGEMRQTGMVAEA
jgi:AraC family transcriptional activator of tynA and feaB